MRCKMRSKCQEKQRIEVHIEIFSKCVSSTAPHIAYLLSIYNRPRSCLA